MKFLFLPTSTLISVRLGLHPHPPAPSHVRLSSCDQLRFRTFKITPRGSQEIRDKASGIRNQRLGADVGRLIVLLCSSVIWSSQWAARGHVGKITSMVGNRPPRQTGWPDSTASRNDFIFWTSTFSNVTQTCCIVLWEGGGRGGEVQSYP